jgi:hypothetical protein
MSELNDDDINFQPYQTYTAQVAALEDFAQQSRLCYKIARSFVQEGGAVQDDDPEQRIQRLAGPINEGPFASMGDMLNRSCLLLEWGYFEGFLRSTTREMLHRHPTGLILAGGHDALDYATIIGVSRQLTALDQLHEAMITRVIERAQAGGQGVLGLIDLIKEVFHFHYDPYTINYSVKGVEHNAQHGDLVELRMVCNLLNGERIQDLRVLQAAHPHFDDGAGGLHIPAEFYARATNLLGATSAAIARSIDSRWYDRPL